MGAISLFVSTYRLYFMVGLVVAAVGLMVLAYNKGYKNATNAAAAKELIAVQKAVAKAQEIAASDAAISTANMATTEKIRIVTNTIIKEKRIYAKANPLNCVLDDTRMRAIADTIRSEITASPATTDSALPFVTKPSQ